MQRRIHLMRIPTYMFNTCNDHFEQNVTHIHEEEMQRPQYIEKLFRMLHIARVHTEEKWKRNLMKNKNRLLAVVCLMKF